jgi:hypothetical protein
MDQSTVRSFTERYLQSHHCHMIESTPSHLITQLSIEVDKELLNRPFYWMYVEKMNLPPQPSRFCFIFHPEETPADLHGEYLFHGSQRFTQMLESAQKLGQFVRLYQEPRGLDRYGHSKSYTPWLGIHFKISYVCDQKMDRLSYLGFNLQSGEIREGFYQRIQPLSWTSKLPAQRHTVSPRFSITEAVGECEYYLQDQLENEERIWQQQALARLTQELEQLDRFYPDEANISEELHKEKKQRQRETMWQYHPRVEIKVINAGLFYVEAGEAALSFE